MKIFLQGITPSGAMTPILVTEDGALVQAQDNGQPGFIAFTATTVATALPSHAAKLVEIVNDTESDLLVDRGAVTPQSVLKGGNAHVFKVAANTHELRLSVAEGTATPGIIEYWG